MMEFGTTKTVMALVLILFVLIAFRQLRKQHQLARSRINFDDLLLGEDGKLSKAAAVMMGSFAMTTWLMVYLAMNEKMTEGYFTAYLGAWVLPTVAKLVMNRPLPNVATVEETTISTTKTATPKGE